MSTNEEAKILGMVLSSDAQRNLLLILETENKGFSELMHKLKMTSGNLNYHLLRLQNAGLLITKQQRYTLTGRGLRIAKKVEKALE
jgi:predicted transcriptional regulator